MEEFVASTVTHDNDSRPVDYLSKRRASEYLRVSHDYPGQAASHNMMSRLHSVVKVLVVPNTPYFMVENALNSTSVSKLPVDSIFSLSGGL